MTGLTLLSIIAVACLVRIAFVVGDIRDALHEVRSMSRKQLLALEAVIAKLDRSFAGSEKAQQFEAPKFDAPKFDAPSIANMAQEQRDGESETMEDLPGHKTKAEPDEELPAVSRLLLAWNDVRTKLLASNMLRGATDDADGKGSK